MDGINYKHDIWQRQDKPRGLFESSYTGISIAHLYLFRTLAHTAFKVNFETTLKLKTVQTELNSYLVVCDMQ